MRFHQTGPTKNEIVAVICSRVYYSVSHRQLDNCPDTITGKRVDNSSIDKAIDLTPNNIHLDIKNWLLLSYFNNCECTTRKTVVHFIIFHVSRVSWWIMDGLLSVGNESFYVLVHIFMVSKISGRPAILLMRAIVFVRFSLRAAYKININIIQNTILTYNSNIIMDSFILTMS